ncbi:MerR family transcriptional regulator [Phenylobacterium sp.]|uniref:MerR family transcriptional regulator n=1 Tax=Phenylobacterium sp. TaxID=1871053 RepID=UPI00261CC410|nr:MerR family transcriptional regulator [Phenylobacterium sp.]
MKRVGNPPPAAYRPDLSRCGVGAAMRRFGLTPRALRFYEERGLITVGRDRLNRRWYDVRARERLSWISLLRTCGLGLSDIRKILDLDREPGTMASLAAAFLDKRAQQLTQDLARVRNGLDVLLSPSARRAG